MKFLEVKSALEGKIFLWASIWPSPKHVMSLIFYEYEWVCRLWRRKSRATTTPVVWFRQFYLIFLVHNIFLLYKCVAYPYTKNLFWQLVLFTAVWC